MLSGAMDIIVISEPDGQFRSSSFHVRFGSLKVVRSKKREIEIYINGRRKDVKMKLSNNGDAYFAFDELDEYMIKQSKLIRNKEFNANQKTLEDLISPVRVSKDEAILKKKYKSFFPSSNQLKLLELKQGRNEICFVCSTSPGGVQTLKANIYLWPYTSKLIISDVDGTITKSDILGQVLPFFGKDWSHDGVAELFTNIYNNGYKIIYLTARAIGQSSLTRYYLENLVQEKHILPPGPLLMSPDGIFASLKREVINKKPHLLKIPLLLEIKNLFPAEIKPLYAGFGNRETDAVAYRYLEIPMNKIFIIDTSSRVVQLGETKKTTYKTLAGIVDINFPKFNESDEPDVSGANLDNRNNISSNENRLDNE